MHIMLRFISLMFVLWLIIYRTGPIHDDAAGLIPSESSRAMQNQVPFYRQRRMHIRMAAVLRYVH